MLDSFLFLNHHSLRLSSSLFHKNYFLLHHTLLPFPPSSLLKVLTQQLQGFLDAVEDTHTHSVAGDSSTETEVERDTETALQAIIAPHAGLR